MANRASSGAKNQITSRKYKASGAFEGFQNTPLQVYGRPDGPSDVIDWIVAAMALPDQAPSMRLAPGDASRSSQGQTFERLGAAWSSDSSKDTLTAFIQRCAECSAIVETYNDAAAAYRYNAWINQSAPGSEDSAPALTALVIWTGSKPIQYATMTWDPESALSPHTDTIFAGAVEKSLGNFVWLEAGDVFTVDAMWTNPNAGSDQTISLTLDRWTPSAGLQPGEEEGSTLISDVNPIGSIAVPVTVSGYYAPNFACETDGSIFSMSMYFSGSASRIWGHRPMPEYADYVGKSTGIVQIGVAPMYSNKAAKGYRQGELVAFQIPKGQHWMNFREFDAIFSAEGSVPLEADMGIYAPLKPAAVDDLQFQTNVSVSTTGFVTQSKWRVDGGRAVMALTAKIAAGSASAPNPRDAFWSFLYNFQFQTASKWFDKDFTTVTSQQVQTAIDRLKWMPVATENPSHFKDYLKAIVSVGKHAINGVEKYGPTAINVAKGVRDIAQLMA